jgi:uncharacterized protein (DUF2062 family)
MQLKALVQVIAGKGMLLVKRVFRGGLTPQKLAQTLCLGTATGIMPLLWGTTILSALLAAFFKLNQAAMQALNYLCYPLQLALFIPFCQLGEYIFPWGPAVSVDVLTSALHGHLGAALGLIGWATVKALGAWLLTAAPLALISYPLLRIVLKRKGEPCVNPEDSSNPAG